MATEILFYNAVFRIRDVLIKIQIRESIQLIYGSRSCSFLQWVSRCQQKKVFPQMDGSGFVQIITDPEPGGIKKHRIQIRNTAELNTCRCPLAWAVQHRRCIQPGKCLKRRIFFFLAADISRTAQEHMTDLPFSTYYINMKK
jgi:hypothetical protein